MRVGPVDVPAPVVPIGSCRSAVDCAGVRSAVAFAEFLEQAADKARATTSEAVVVFIRMEIS
jgi:hypothetical protein